MKDYIVVSLDGGGIRGVLSSVVFQSVIDSIEKSGNKVDLIVGTSTGAIISGAYARGYTPEEITEFYKKEASNIFKKTFNWFGIMPKYSIARMHKVLHKYLKGDDELKCKVATTVYDKNSGKSMVMKSWDNPHNLNLSDIVTASASAPTYFASFRKNGLSLIDGGVYANNPALVGLALATELKEKDQKVKIISIGTGNYEKGFSNKENILTQAKNIPGMMLDSNYEIVNWYIDRLKGDDVEYKRINCAINQEHHAMDGVKNIPALIKYGEDLNRKFKLKL